MLNTRRVLLVEDDFINAMVMEQYFDRTFDFKHVNNGHDALAELGNRDYDVVIMDINLGDEEMDGVKTLSLIRQKPELNDVVVFAVTGYAMAGDEAKFMVSGFDRYIAKFVNFEELEQTILQEPGRGFAG